MRGYGIYNLPLPCRPSHQAEKIADILSFLIQNYIASLPSEKTVIPFCCKIFQFLTLASIKHRFIFTSIYLLKSLWKAVLLNNSESIIHILLSALLNWFMDRLCRALCTVHSISAQISQEGIKCTKFKELPRSYCPKLYIVDSV